MALTRTEPPTELRGPLVVLARADIGHLDGLQDAIEQSHRELHAFMDWAGEEPQARPATLDYLETRAEAWRTGEAFAFTMLDPATAEAIGGCSLMSRQGPGRLEIGYWVRSDRTGAGIATAAARLLTDAGLAIDGIGIVEIHHDANNLGSARVPEKLGYKEVARNDVEIDSPGECGVEVIWEITGADRL